MRFLLRPGAVMVWAVLSTVAGIVCAAAISQWWWILPAVGASLLIAIPSFTTLHGGSLFGIFSRRRRKDGGYMPVRVREVDGACVILEGDTVSVWAEVLPENDVELTTVSGDGISTRPYVQLDKIVPFLTQSDVAVEDVTVTTVGYSSFLPSYPAANVVMSSVGNVSESLGGRTWITVRVNVADNIVAASKRSPRTKRSDPVDNFDQGMMNAVVNAMSRVRVVVEEGGHSVVFLSPEMIKQATSIITVGTSGVFDGAHAHGFDSASNESVHAFAFYTRRRPSRPDVTAWAQLPATRTIVSTTVTPIRGTRDSARVSDNVIMVSRNEKIVSQAKKLGLFVLPNQQRQIASRVIPAVRSLPVSQENYPLERGVPHPVLHRGGGVGTYIGTTPQGDKLFVRVRPFTGATLHLVGTPEFHRIMVMRMLMETETINVRVPEGTKEYNAWKYMEQWIHNPLFAVGDVSQDADIVVTTADMYAHVRSECGDDQTIIVVSETTPSMALVNAITVSGDMAVATANETKQERAYFVPTPAEVTFVAAPDDNS